jgi:hypothetical protein
MIRSALARLWQPTSPNRLGRLVALIVVLAGLLVFIRVVPIWVAVLIPRWVVRGASVGFLWGLLVIFIAAAPAALAGLVYGLIGIRRAGRRCDRGGLTVALRWTLLASSCLAALIVMEAVSAVRLRGMLRMADLPTQFERAHPESRSAADLHLVIVGESSARGEPYHPWLSVGQIVGWQLEQVFPGRKIRVDVRAEGGLCLEQAILLLLDLKERPDAIIVFAGHNEFQTRFGWSRNVRHYADEGPRSTLALIDLARSTSSTAHLILATLDRYVGEAAPPPHVTRELVDHPICSASEHAFLLEDFTRRLDELAAYCNRIGATPILIAPASNDGAFEPNRSILDGSATAHDRAEFARDFQAAQAAESRDPDSAIAAYRRLLARHPEFAESHYRLARLLADRGSWNEAREHYIAARDFDAFPLRCPTDFLEAIRSVARRHEGVLIDAPDLLSRLSPRGILDDGLFHDAQHLNLTGYVALAQEVVQQLCRRRAFGWPASIPAPQIDLAACARRFKMDAAKWSTVCERSRSFYARTAYVRYDPSERLSIAARYEQANRDLAAGRALHAAWPRSLKIPVPILDRAEVPPKPSQRRDRPGM